MYEAKLIPMKMGDGTRFSIARSTEWIEPGSLMAVIDGADGTQWLRVAKEGDRDDLRDALVSMDVISPTEDFNENR